MKKLFVLFVILICTVSLNAQNKYFNLTPHWLVSVSDSTKNYVVIIVDSTSAENLYKKTINYINMTYKNPESVIRGKSENEFLTFATHDEISVKFMAETTVDVDYFTTISYKNDKIKIIFSDIEMYYFNQGKKLTYSLIGGGWSGWSVYKESDLSLWYPKKQNNIRIESYFNNKVDEIISGIKTDVKSESW